MFTCDNIVCWLTYVQYRNVPHTNDADNWQVIKIDAFLRSVTWKNVKLCIFEPPTTAGQGEHRVCQVSEMIKWGMCHTPQWTKCFSLSYVCCQPLFASVISNFTSNAGLCMRRFSNSKENTLPFNWRKSVSIIEFQNWIPIYIHINGRTGSMQYELQIDELLYH